MSKSNCHNLLIIIPDNIFYKQTAATVFTQFQKEKERTFFIEIKKKTVTPVLSAKKVFWKSFKKQQSNCMHINCNFVPILYSNFHPYFIKSCETVSLSYDLFQVANRFIPDNLDMFVLDRTGPGFISAIVVKLTFTTAHYNENTIAYRTQNIINLYFL